MSCTDNAEEIDWSPLLGRAAVPLPFATKAVTNKRVLITGAGGSIGSALARQVARSQPASLVLLDAAEHALYDVSRSLDEHSADAIDLILGSVGDRPLLEAIVRDRRPQIVFHAAAFKHVTVVEQNPFAGIANNVFGTSTLIASASQSVEQFVMVSTDKAADPASLMGASKRIAELILLSSPLPAKIVRLGNVLGSRGSVVPLFLEQIARGLPLTVTHANAGRYWITVDEAVRSLCNALVTAAPLMAAEAGEPLPVADLARFLLDRAGQPTERVSIAGLRPGDKLTESLIACDETWLWPAWSPLALRAIASPVPAPEALADALDRLHRAVDARALPMLLDAIEELVPGYQPSASLTAQAGR